MRSLERAVKRGLIRLAGPLFPTRPPAGTLDRVLLVRVDDRLGNLILLSPALDWLRRNLPSARIELLVSRTFAAIYANDHRIDRLRILDKGKQKALFPVFFRDLRRVADGKYDAVLECSDRNAFSFSSALYARASRAPRRIGFANELARHFLTEEVPFPEERHAARDPLALAGALLGLAPPPIEECRLSVDLPEPAPEWRRELDAMADRAADRIVGMHVGGRGRKRWPMERFDRLAHGLLDAGSRPWIFRGPMEEEADLFEEAVQRGAVLVPRGDIVRIGQALTRCRLVIAPDTGPMHLASAVGARTLALFLSSDPDCYHPLHPADRWLDARREDLSVSSVLEAALPMLGASRAAEAR